MRAGRTTNQPAAPAAAASATRTAAPSRSRRRVKAPETERRLMSRTRSLRRADRGAGRRPPDGAADALGVGRAARGFRRGRLLAGQQRVVRGVVHVLDRAAGEPDLLLAVLADRLE